METQPHIQERHWSYKATAVSSTGTEAATGGVELGSLVYSEEDKSLALVNRDTSLQRKVLLLGYSKKASHHDIIGQFGEPSVCRDTHDVAVHHTPCSVDVN